jgi:hypothetical protein
MHSGFGTSHADDPSEKLAPGVCRPDPSRRCLVMSGDESVKKSYSSSSPSKLSLCALDTRSSASEQINSITS